MAAVYRSEHGDSTTLDRIKALSYFRTFGIAKLQLDFLK